MVEDYTAIWTHPVLRKLFITFVFVGKLTKEAKYTQYGGSRRPLYVTKNNLKDSLLMRPRQY